jgi:hypothetical protein
LLSRSYVPERFLSPNLPEITPLQCSLVKGFNTEQSTIDLDVMAEVRRVAKVAYSRKAGDEEANAQSEVQAPAFPSTSDPPAYPMLEPGAPSKTAPIVTPLSIALMYLDSRSPSPVEPPIYAMGG